MRESISYTFLLNIVIIFVFTCFAIVMGVLSYYKAFRANTIISETIEKYEGYNCLAKDEIARKLGNIGYNVPFEVNCKKNDGKCDDSGNGYKVISYNLDFEGNLVYDGEPMNSSYICEDKDGVYACATNKHYQYGIYTYMYVELPVISGLIRIPFFSKTSTMYEFRNFYISDYIYIDKKYNEKTWNNHQISDTSSLLDELYNKFEADNKIYVSDAILGKTIINEIGKTETDINAIHFLYDSILNYYTKSMTKGAPTYEILTSYITNDPYKNYRTRAVIEHLKRYKTDNVDSSMASRLRSGSSNGAIRKECGYMFDYSVIND